MARRASRRDTELQAFTPLAVAWSGRGEVPTVNSLEALGPGLRLTGKRLLAGLYVNELLMRSLPRGEAHATLYTRYIQTLAALSEGGLEWPLRLFEYDLLEALGYGARTPTGETEVNENRSDYPACDALSEPAQRALASGELPEPADLAHIKRYLAAELERHVLARGIKTRELLRVW